MLSNETRLQGCMMHNITPKTAFFLDRLTCTKA